MVGWVCREARLPYFSHYYPVVCLSRVVTTVGPPCDLKRQTTSVRSVCHPKWGHQSICPALPCAGLAKRRAQLPPVGWLIVECTW